MWFSKITDQTSKRGLSLLELMVVMTLLGIFFGAVYETVLVGLRNVGSADTREGLRLQLARTLDRFTREVRMARNVTAATDTQFQFDADFNGDGDATDSGEAGVNYQISGTTLTRAQGGVTITILNNLSSASAVDVFQYYELNGTTESDTCNNGSGCGTATCTPSGCQCLCEVRVAVLTATVTTGSETLTMSDSAFLGNI